MSKSLCIQAKWVLCFLIGRTRCCFLFGSFYTQSVVVISLRRSCGFLKSLKTLGSLMWPLKMMNSTNRWDAMMVSSAFSDVLWFRCSVWEGCAQAGHSMSAHHLQSLQISSHSVFCCELSAPARRTCSISSHFLASVHGDF